MELVVFWAESVYLQERALSHYVFFSVLDERAY